MKLHPALRHIPRIAIATALAAMSLVTSSPSAHAATRDGALDTSFGIGGVVISDISGRDDYVNAVAVQADGQIVVVGSGTNATTDRDFVLSVFYPDGTLGGVVATDFSPGSEDEARALVIQPDGKFVSAGDTSGSGTGRDFAIARHNTNGTIDTTFGSGGKVTDAISATGDAVNALALQADGKIVAAGYSSNRTMFTIARYNSDGTRDSTFGVGGVITTSLGRGGAAQAVVVQADGKLLAAGSSADSAAHLDFAIVRYNPDGSLDTTFGTNGLVTSSLSPGNDNANALVVLPDGKIVAAGSTDSKVAVVRYNPNGTPDTSFGTNGAVTTSFGGGIGATSLVLQPDGKLVTGGYDTTGSSVDFALVRFNPNGTLDATFGNRGKTATEVGSPSYAIGTSLALQADGEIVAAGYALNGAQYDFALARYDVTYPGLVTGTPTRILDTRPGAKPKGGSVTRVNSGASPGTSSVLVNLTVTGAEGSGYLAADACSTLDPNGQSNLNYQPGNDIANTSVISLDPDGSFCIYTSTTTHLIIDRQGTYLPDGYKLATINPKRVLDTRTTTKPRTNTITRVQTGAPAGTTAVLVNLTVTGAEGSGYITADRCSVLTPGLQTKSNANYQTGNDIANTSVVNIDPDGSFCIYTDQTAHLLADLQGTYQAATGKNLIKPPARRLLDTRTGTKPAANTITKVQTHAPAGTTAVLVNLTVTGPQANGYITADKCSTLFPGPQTNSNANYHTDADVANTAVINIDPDGTFCIYTNQATHLLADLQGTY